MINPLAMKLEQYTSFTDEERQRLDALLAVPTRDYARGEPIISEGDEVGDVYLVVRGLAVRAKTLRNGERQIMALLVPGDLCDVEVFVLERMDHDILAIAPTTCALIPAEVMEGLLTESSKLTRALWWSTMTDCAVLRERIVDHGSRGARERIAHLICEMLVRFRVVGVADGGSFPFPLTQEELSQATGLTPVHVNRMLQQLRAEGLIEHAKGRMTVLDHERLQAAAGYESGYLHLTRTERRDSAVSGRAGDLVAAAGEDGGCVTAGERVGRTG
jgi:CRP-like cAMP-binding protein